MRIKSFLTGGEMYEMLVSDNGTVYDHDHKLFYHPDKLLALTTVDVEEFGLGGNADFFFDLRFVMGGHTTPANFPKFAQVVPKDPMQGNCYLSVHPDGKGYAVALPDGKWTQPRELLACAMVDALHYYENLL
jgi:hypothetical protein